jgi:hypothetical protein
MTNASFTVEYTSLRGKNASLQTLHTLVFNVVDK